jgi:hypothetical protein
MFELARRARWLDVLDLLASGHPPIYIQLLAANALFLAYVILRGMFNPAAKRKATKSKYRMEIMVIVVNFAILYQHSWLPYFDSRAIAIYVRNLMQL